MNINTSSEIQMSNRPTEQLISLIQWTLFITLLIGIFMIICGLVMSIRYGLKLKRIDEKNLEARVKIRKKSLRYLIILIIGLIIAIVSLLIWSIVIYCC